MSDLKEKKFGYIVNNQPCPGHLHPPYPPMPPPVPGVTMKDLIQYVNSYIDVRAKQIYEKIKEHQGGIDKQEIIDAVIAQFRTEIGNEVASYITTHYDFDEIIRQKIDQMDILTPESPEIQNLSNSVQDMQGSVQGLGTSVANLNTTVQSLASDVGSLNKKVDALTASASNFATKDSVSQVEASVSALSAAMSSYATNERVNAIDDSVSALASNMADVGASLSSLKSSFDGHMEKYHEWDDSDYTIGD